MLADLPRILEWRDVGSTPQTWRSDFLGRLESGFRELCDGGGEPAELARQLDAVPEERRARLLRSPWLSYGILRRRPWLDIELAARAVRAELVRAGVAPATAEPLWTAHGDECFTAAGAAGGSRAGTDLPIALDEASPFPVPPPGAPLEPLATEDRVLVRRRIAETLEAIRAISAGLHDIVARFDEVIVVRRGPGESRFRCGSHDRLVGIVILRNPHLPHVSLAFMADAVVHESTHNMLRNHEALHGEFAKGSGDAIESPWSGNPLSLQSYVHACAVWYGLVHFWELVATSGHPSWMRADVETARRRAAGGFLARPVSRLDPFLARVRPEIVSALREMEARILS